MDEQQAAHKQRAPARGPVGSWQAGTLALGVAACVFLAAVAVPGLHERIGAPPKTRVVSALLGDLALAGFALAVIIALTLAHVLQPRRRRKPEEPEFIIERPPTTLLERLILGLIALATLAAPIATAILLLHRGPTRVVLPQLTPSGAHAGPLHTPVPAGHAAAIRVDWWLFAVLGVAAVVGLLILAHARRRPLHARASPSSATAALAAVIDDLEHERDPRRAVIKAYARMERVLGEYGVPRQPFEAPLEYLGRALERLRAGSGSVGRITALFERARFSHHEIDEPMRADAVAALQRLRSELGRKR